MLNSNGIVEINFTEAIQFPEDLESRIIASQGKEDAIFEVSLIEPYDEVSSKIESWSIKSVTPKKIVIKIDFP